MTKYDVDKVRIFALVGHGDAGKTSLTEAMLYDANMTTRLGKIEQGNTVTDYDTKEVKRGITINSSLAYLNWKDSTFNIIDTPGYLDFIIDTKSSLRVVDCSIIVVCGVSGVEVQTEKVWDYSEEFQLPRIFFINKLDRERADFSRVSEMIRENFGQNAVPIQLPIGVEENFQGLVDLLKMKAYYFQADKDGKNQIEEKDIPDDLKAKANEFRQKMIEAVAEFDDEILMKYLDGEELTKEEILTCLKGAIMKRKVFPVLCGSATKNIGIELLLDFIKDYFPNPIELPDILVKNLKEQKDIQLKRAVGDAPFAALVFKTVTDPYVGNLTYFRVFSGELNSDSSIYNASQDIENKVGKIFRMQGKEQTPITIVSAGGIGAIAKLKKTNTGDTLCDKEFPIEFKKIEYPEPIMKFAIFPKSKGDEDKLSIAINRIQEEEPTIRIYRDEDTGETIIAGMGESHLDVVIETMETKFGVEIEKSIPKVGYKETIRKKVQAEGKYKKQSGGRGQYGHCFVEFEPIERGKGFEFVDKIVGGVIPKQYRPAVEKGIVEAMRKGVVAGYPTVDIRATLYDGSYHTVDSSEMAFKVAGSLAFKKGVTMADPIILEPIYDLEVIVPKEYMGDIIGDLNSKRGRIMGMDEAGKGKQIIKAQVPQAEMFRYSIDLRSITQGRGIFTMKFSHYEEVPPQIAQEIIDKAKKEIESES
ncbi:MAG: elongation factor G [Atribacterota bacterium]|nr:elongation factor G [Atribacterota bacterium]MDD4895770.1 elongation factor G [Atribacterota bacterium]MDD5637032.1 elongation factor G [Atribacterota bacterium]